MPTYDYACNHCGHRFEKFQSFKEDALTICPNCGTAALRKVFSPSGIVFKGSGWYINDSRSNSKSGAAKDGATKVSSETTSEKSSDSTSGDKSSETKPAESKPAETKAAEPAA